MAIPNAILKDTLDYRPCETLVLKVRPMLGLHLPRRCAKRAEVPVQDGPASIAIGPVSLVAQDGV